MTNRERRREFRKRFRGWLEYRLKDEVLNLRGLGCTPDAWRVLRVAFDIEATEDAYIRALRDKPPQKFVDYLTGTCGSALFDIYRSSGGVLFLYNRQMARELLGPEDEPFWRLGFNPLRQHARYWRRREHAEKLGKRLGIHQDWIQCNPSGSRRLESPKWLAAQSAAVAAAVLRKLNDPLVTGIGMRALENFERERVFLRVRDFLDELAEGRKRGGAAAGPERHANYEKTKVKRRDEYVKRLKAAKKEQPRLSWSQLSAPIIAAMAAREGYSPKQMRDIIKPRERWLEMYADA